MHRIIQVVGGLTVFVGVAMLVFGVLVAFASPGAVLASFPVLAGSFGMIVSGAMLYCFGAIVGHLIAIRRNGEAQLRIFQDRLVTASGWRACDILPNKRAAFPVAKSFGRDYVSSVDALPPP